MVITVTCPSCSSAFPVDPAKIPEGGVNALCSSCGDIFRVEKPAAPPPPAELPTVADAVLVDAGAGSWVGTAEEAVVADPDPFPNFSEQAAEPEPPPPGNLLSEVLPFEGTDDEVPEAASGGVQGFTFGKRDSTDRAKRLARVLVADMIMYNAERYQSALSAGTLVHDFEEEIDKSWKEYIDQVGEEMANGAGRGFWTEALNSILAKGEEVF